MTPRERRQQQTVRLFLNAVCFLVACAAFAHAKAEGPNHLIDGTHQWACNMPTTYTDGTAIPSGVELKIRIYQTQVPAEKGTPVFVGTNTCDYNQTFDASMATGQWYAYATAEQPKTDTQEARPEGPFSNAAPFTLLPPATVSPGAVTNLR